VLSITIIKDLCPFFPLSETLIIMRGYAAIALLLHLCSFIVRTYAIIRIDRFLRKRIKRRKASRSHNKSSMQAHNRVVEQRYNALSCITRDNYIIGDNLSAVFQARNEDAFNDVFSVQVKHSNVSRISPLTLT